MRQRVLKEALAAAGKAIRETRDKDIKSKGSAADLVTAADLASEKAAEAVISWHTDDDFLSEEKPESHQKVLQSSWSGWVIDPIDGTNNFARGIPYYCISLAYVQRGIVALGGIFDPVHDQLWLAEKGKGATRNSGRISVSDTEAVSAGARICSSNSYNFQETLENIKRFQGLEAGWFDFLSSATLNFAYVADGRLDLYYTNSLKPWDNAAGFLIANEAGAVTKRMDGSDALWHDGEMIIGNQSLVKNFLEQQK